MEIMEQRDDDHHNGHVSEIDEKLGKKIDEELRKLSPIPSERCIFKVHEALRNSNVKAYEPEIVAIGPYHRARYDKNPHLLPMEERKLRNLKQLLQRRNETSVSYVVAMRDLEKKARKFYAEPISLSTNEFVEMMLLDGCFIIELLRNNIEKILGPDHIWSGLKRDLLLFENQLPLFILEKLFSMTTVDQYSAQHIILMVLYFYLDLVRPDHFERTIEGVNQIKDHTHLLSLVHCCACYSFKYLKPKPEPNQPSADQKRFNIKPATELQEAGVEFKKFEPATSDGSRATTLGGLMQIISKTLYKFNCINGVLQIFGRGGPPPYAPLHPSLIAADVQEARAESKKVEKRSLFDIRFQNGRMEIPTFAVGDETESLFRNFIAYEQYLPENELRCFTNYTHVIDCLVNSSKDVAILRDHGIVDNFLGDDEVVSSMLNKLGDGVTLDEDFYKCYGQLFDDVHKHCNRRMNKWLAILRRDYFNSPWAIISFAAALVLLLLTVIQTVISILSVV